MVIQLAQSHVVPAQGTTWSLANSPRLRVSQGRDALVLVQLNNLRATAPVLELRQGSNLVSSRALNPPAQLPPSEGGDEKFASNMWSVTVPGAEVAEGMSLLVRDGGRELNAPVAVTVAPRTDVTFQLLSFLLFGAPEDASELKAMTADEKAQGVAGMPYTTSTFVRHPLGAFESSFLVLRPDGTHAASKITNADGLSGRDNPLLDMVWTINDATGDETLQRVTYGSVFMKKANGERKYWGGGVSWTGSGGAVGDPGFGLLWHEGGHAMSLGHSPADYDGGGYPYLDGSLKGSAWGYDQSKNYFRAPFTAPDSYYATCQGDKAARGGRSFAKDSRGRCYRFDPMHSADEQKTTKAAFPLFSDYNAARMQRWALGRDKVNAGNTGFMQLNSNGQWVENADASKTYNYAWDGFNNKHADPDMLNREWDFVYTTRSLADTPGATEFYPPIRHVGNARKLIDPMVQSELDSINAADKKASYYKYCRQSGCDFTVRATYEHPVTRAQSTAYRVLRGSGRQSDKPDTWKDDVLVDTSRDSFVWWAIRLPVPAGQPKLIRLELLDTPMVWTRTAHDIRNATVLKTLVLP
ncbi:M66 family metalloprotease [Rhodoferax aquaticus]|uniref:Dictomallein n=1 Tax=Rhodoferax aquaticus TaxID=2527691 RepID=A0A515ESA9_9BURK|nr:M66 family metalloprotease [Rhodoferax aquaticus]QDL55539.1 hypothetical protein EXZ61_15900 [Rhodoferax aquaticus]